MPVRTLLADDHAIVTSGLKAILAGEGGFEVVGVANNGMDAVSQAKALKPDLVLMDIQMPKLDGIGALVAMREQVPETKVLMLTSLDDEATLFRVIQAGGSGYILKRSADEELLGAIAHVMAGKAFVRPAVTELIAADFMDRVADGSEYERYEKLTPREKEVLAVLARGLTNQQIADAFILSVRTVETHRANLMDKLGFTNRAELVSYALRKGYLA